MPKDPHKVKGEASDINSLGALLMTLASLHYEPKFVAKLIKESQKNPLPGDVHSFLHLPTPMRKKGYVIKKTTMYNYIMQRVFLKEKADTNKDDDEG